MKNPISIKACIFDLDGVVVDTAKYHFEAWKKLAKKIGYDFTESENEALKGVSRVDSLKYILKLAKVEITDAEFLKYLSIKNEWYLDLISSMDDSEILPGVLDFLNELKAGDVKIALGSSSKNARRILTQINLNSYFDVIVDGTDITKSKPDPQVFIMGASQLCLPVEKIIVFEDAQSGIDAANSAGFHTIGIGKDGILKNADILLPSMAGITVGIFEQLVGLKK